MLKKIWIAALAAILAVSAGIGSFVVFGSINDLPKAKRTISQEEHDKVKKKYWDSYYEIQSKYYNELKNSSEYDSIDDNGIKNSIINADATIKADMDNDSYLLDLLKRNNIIGKDMTLESMGYSEDHKEYYDYLRALCKLYNDTDIFLTNEEIVRIEDRLEHSYSDLFSEEAVLETNYNKDEVLQLQKLIRDTIGLEEPDPNITH